jgi:hypothetical protein
MQDLAVVLARQREKVREGEKERKISRKRERGRERGREREEGRERERAREREGERGMQKYLIFANRRWLEKNCGFRCYGGNERGRVCGWG